jgi:hypothetical protein
VYRELEPAATRFGDPLETRPANSFFRWLNGPADSASSGSVTRLWKRVYDHRSDVRTAYPNIAGSGGGEFLEWARRFGAVEHGIAEEFLPGATAQADGEIKGGGCN